MNGLLILWEAFFCVAAKKGIYDLRFGKAWNTVIARSFSATIHISSYETVEKVLVLDLSVGTVSFSPDALRAVEEAF